MAILKCGGNTYEVRIKRYPQGTYFDEYVTTESRIPAEVKTAERRIIGEADQMYTVELTIHEGFHFGVYDRVNFAIWLPGQSQEIAQLCVRKPDDYKGHLKQAITTELQSAKESAVGAEMSGKRFVFRSLIVGKITRNTIFSVPTNQFDR